MIAAQPQSVQLGGKSQNMNTSDSSSKAVDRDLKGVRRIRLATLCLLSIVVLSGEFVAAWFAGVGAIQRIFVQIQFMQEANPMWLEVPIVIGGYLLALLVMKVSLDRTPELLQIF